jgi:hypothetical protein
MDSAIMTRPPSGVCKEGWHFHEIFLNFPEQ